MAIDLSSYTTTPWAFVRKTLHATPGSLDLVSLPPHTKVLTIKAAGTGTVKITHTGAQDATIGSDYFTIGIGSALTLSSVQIHRFPLRITGSVGGDSVEFIVETAMGA